MRLFEEFNNRRYNLQESIDSKGNIVPEPDDIAKEKSILRNYRKITKKQAQIQNKNIKSNTQAGEQLKKEINRRLSASTTKGDQARSLYGTGGGSTEGAGGANTGTTPTKTKTAVATKPTRTKPKRLEGPELKKEIKKITKKPRTLVGSGKGFNTPAVKKVKSGIAKRLATQTKTAQKKLIKTAAKKAATKGIAKVGGKFLAKRIPGLGAVISGAEAVGKLATGDVVGAGLAAGEGILSSIPGLGTVGSTALGGYSAVRDARRAAKATSTVRKVLKSTKGAKGAAAVKKAFKASPKITKKLSPTSKKGFKGFMSKVKDPKTAIGKTARIGGGVGLDVITPGGITKKIVRGIMGGAKGSADGGHVGRRSAG